MFGIFEESGEKQQRVGAEAYKSLEAALGSVPMYARVYHVGEFSEYPHDDTLYIWNWYTLKMYDGAWHLTENEGPILIELEVMSSETRRL